MPDSDYSLAEAGRAISRGAWLELIEAQRSGLRETPREINSGAILPSRWKPGVYRIEVNTVDGLLIFEDARRVGPLDVQAEFDRNVYRMVWIDEDRLDFLDRDWQLTWGYLDLTEDEVAELEVIDASDRDRLEPDSTWFTADGLADEILSIESETPSRRLREVILLAEDTEFTPEQSARLAPRLLDIAKQRRDSNDPQDEPVVLSAIRTGASMLRPSEAESLLPLLEPGHPIETSLVTLKMLGRVFEAQPPDDIDQHEPLANEARNIAVSLLNPYAITISQSAAMAQLAVYALAAMGSGHLVKSVRSIRQLAVDWFTRRTVRKLRELDEFWQSQRSKVASAHRDLVSDALTELQN